MNATNLNRSASFLAEKLKTSCTALKIAKTPSYDPHLLPKEEADRAFEAGVLWFLEVSSRA